MGTAARHSPRTAEQHASAPAFRLAEQRRARPPPPRPQSRQAGPDKEQLAAGVRLQQQGRSRLVALEVRRGRGAVVSCMDWQGTRSGRSAPTIRAELWTRASSSAAPAARGGPRPAAPHRPSTTYPGGWRRRPPRTAHPHCPRRPTAPWPLRTARSSAAAAWSRPWASRSVSPRAARVPCVCLAACASSQAARLPAPPPKPFRPHTSPPAPPRPAPRLPARPQAPRFPTACRPAPGARARLTRRWSWRTTRRSRWRSCRQVRGRGEGGEVGQGER
jgi:hypothetical protein